MSEAGYTFDEPTARILKNLANRSTAAGAVELVAPIVQSPGGGGGSAGLLYQNYQSVAMYVNASQGDNIIAVRGSTVAGLALATVRRESLVPPNSTFQGGVQLRYFLPSEQINGISRPVADIATGGYVTMSTFGHPVILTPDSVEATAFFAFRFRNMAINTGLYNPFDESFYFAPVLVTLNGEPVGAFGGAAITYSSIIIFG